MIWVCTGDWGGSWLSSEPGPPPPGGLISLALPGSPVRSGSCSQPASPCLFAASRAHPKTRGIWPEHLKGWPEAVALPETHTINVSFTCWGSAPGARRRRLSGRSRDPSSASGEKQPKTSVGQGWQSSPRACPTLPALLLQSDMQSWEEQSQGAIYTVEYACR